VPESNSENICIVRTFRDPASAEVAKSLLESEGITATITPSDPVAAPLGGFTSGIRLYVSLADEERAKTLLRDTDLSDAELSELAFAGYPSPDPVDHLAHGWENRFPDLSGQWTHWLIEAEGVVLSIVPYAELARGLQVIRENHERFGSICVHRARISTDGKPIRQKQRFEISNRKREAAILSRLR